MEHPNLCTYLDIARGKHERIIVVSEYKGASLNEISQAISHEKVYKIACQIALALKYIHGRGITHGHLSLDNILVDSNFNIKLYNYGLSYMTGQGKDVSFPIGLPKYLSPETILGGGGPASDLWTLGIILLELCLGPLWAGLKPGPVLRRILTLMHANSPAERIAREHDYMVSYKAIPENLHRVIESCLKVLPSERITAAKLFESELLKEEQVDVAKHKFSGLLSCPIKFLYHWWQLAGGDIQVELKKQGLIKSSPTILSMPIALLLDGCTLGGRESSLMDRRVAKSGLELLMTRLSHIPTRDFYPLLTCPREHNETALLPKIIRERDTEYQFHRLILFQRLLRGYPYTADLIRTEAAIDIPPLLRGKVWAALLNVVGDIQEQYERIDKETPTITDRQIDVDIPRCHQYCWLLSGNAGHGSLKRLLKAWLLSNPQYVYWQGLDSLTAPFLYLNFNNQARAFACLSRFVPKYLNKFFLKDNSAVIKEYLAKFWQMTAFYEPLLASHLYDINFVPELFAIPWFLTMFSHVFPLHKIVHLWDAFLVEGSSLPLFMGVAILRQLRDTLLASGFNECILLFSDLPEIEIGQCVTESINMCRNSPNSITYRKHAEKDVQMEKDNDPMDDVEIEAAVLFTEMSPRISCNDFLKLLKQDKCFSIDIRSNLLYMKECLAHCLNIPYSGVHLGIHETSSLGAAADKAIQQAVKENRTIVIISGESETAQLFSDYLVKCGVPRICTLQGGISTLQKFLPTLLHPQNTRNVI